MPSPDGRAYLINKEDEKGTAQIYRGAADRFKMQPAWHPSGRWVLLAVERDKYSPPPVLGWSRQYVEGQLQNGLWTNTTCGRCRRTDSSGIA